MKVRILKIQLSEKVSTLSVPEGSKFLDAQFQLNNNELDVMTWWETPLIVRGVEKKVLFLAATGEEFDSDGMNFLKTVHAINHLGENMVYSMYERAIILV